LTETADPSAPAHSIFPFAGFPVLQRPVCPAEKVNSYTKDATIKRRPAWTAFQLVEKVQRKLGFFALIW
jgi:hypothetical protein